MKDTLLLPHGYHATIETDDSPENPFSSRFTDCATPILVFNLEYHGGRLENYKTGICLSDIFWKIPARHFGPKGRVAILDALEIDPQDASAELYRHPRKARAEDWRDAIGGILPEPPYYYSEARKYFEALKFLCHLAKIPCRWEESSGYSQGDSALVFVAATPEWVARVGWNPPTKEAQQTDLEADIDLWSAWAWGDVYGIAELLRPDCTEVPDSSCWGFYGDDHEKSGLREHCISSINYDLRYLAKEADAAHEAACRDIITAA